MDPSFEIPCSDFDADQVKLVLESVENLPQDTLLSFLAHAISHGQAKIVDILLSDRKVATDSNAHFAILQVQACILDVLLSMTGSFRRCLLRNHVTSPNRVY